MLKNTKEVSKKVNDVNVYHLLELLKLSHVPKIISIKQDIVTYEYIEGTTLSEYIKGDVLKMDKILLGLQLIKIVKEINSYEIIHKDIKPENIIVNENKVCYLIDFGASRIDDESKENDSTLLGTRGYASPEHLGYAKTTFKSDMYSLGKVLEFLDLGTSFEKVIKKATAIDPNNRFINYNYFIREYQKCFIDERKKEIQKKEFSKKQSLLKKRNFKIHNLKIFRNFFDLIGYNVHKKKFLDILTLIPTIIIIASVFNSKEEFLISTLFLYPLVIAAFVEPFDILYNTHLYHFVYKKISKNG